MTEPKLARYKTELFIVHQVRKLLMRLVLMTAVGAVTIFIATSRMSMSDIFPANLIYGMELIGGTMTCFAGIFTIASVLTLLDVPVYKGEIETQE